MTELVAGTYTEETRAGLLEVVNRLDVEAVILGGTELPLILRPEDSRVPLLDTTRIHVEEIVAAMRD